MPEYRVKLEVHIYNRGGLDPLMQNLQAHAIQAAEKTGQLTPSEAAKAKQKLAEESRPVEQQCSFSKTISLPYVPIPAIAIDDDGFVVEPSSVTWVPSEDQFTVCMHKMTCSDCVISECKCMKHLMDSDNGWNMYMFDQSKQSQ